MSFFTIQLPLKTSKWQSDILDKRFEIARKIYNTLLSKSIKRYNEMIKTKKYRNLQKNVNSITIKMREQMLAEYGISLNAIVRDVENIQPHFKEHIDMECAYDIAARLWQAYQKSLKLKKQPPQFKKYGKLNSLRGKNNLRGIHYEKQSLIWNKLIIPVIIKANDFYIQEALRNSVAFCRIIRKYIHGKYHYYLQLVLVGQPPALIDYRSGKFKHPLGKGDVGIDIGVKTIAIVSEKEVKLIDLARFIEPYENKIKKLQRKMDRSRRQCNPNNYQEDGTIKKEGKLVWIKSNHYLRYENEMREIYRKYHDSLKNYHDTIANYILSLGDKIYVEAMDFEELKRNYQEINNRKIRKQNFGRSIYLNAPSRLLATIERKLGYHGLKLYKIDTKKARASQYNHFNQTYQKKSLSQRWNDFDGTMVHRDLYSAFLIMNINQDLQTFNLNKCESRYNQFIKLHNQEIAKL